MKKADPWRLWSALLLCMGMTLCLRAEDAPKATLHLKNGDRLTGEILSEDGERIVLSTCWNTAIYVPKSEIVQAVAIVPAPARNEADAGAAELVTVEAAREQPPPLPARAGATNAGRPVTVAGTKPTKTSPPATRKAKHWKWSLKLGADLVKGAKDRSVYFGQTALTYTRAYERTPKEFLRNKIEYRVDYGETDGQVSANRMVGVNKLDFDIGSGYYGYAALGAGCDTVRKIEYQYEVGPGVGYHLVAAKSIVLDPELGFNYQYRGGLGEAPDREVIQLRIGQEFMWEVVPRITLSEQMAFLPSLDDLGEYQVRVRGNLGFGIVRHLSLNLTVLNLYDTLPAPGVPNNEFQFQSSLGVNF